MWPIFLKATLSLWRRKEGSQPWKKPVLAETVFEKSPWQPNSFQRAYRKQWLMGLPSLPENKVVRHREVSLPAAYQRFLRFVKKTKGTTEVDCQSRLQGAHSKAQYGQSNKTASAEDKNLHFHNKEKSFCIHTQKCRCTYVGIAFWMGSGGKNREIQ